MANGRRPMGQMTEVADDDGGGTNGVRAISYALYDGPKVNCQMKRKRGAGMYGIQSRGWGWGANTTFRVYALK